MKPLGNLELWLDPVARPGPEAMAVDEWLLETATTPVLRVYGWAGAWASVGYFGKIEVARAAFPGVAVVRRWTGGGTVDHRGDWTYTLVVPKSEPLATLKGAESYRLVHAALGSALAAEGIPTGLAGGDGSTGAALCFANPVAHDVLDAGGRKLAGAGQRHARTGLMHQGSVAGAAPARRAEIFAAQLAATVGVWENLPDATDLARRTAARYANPEWTNRR